MKKALILAILLPSLAKANCFERYYNQAHLDKHPKQVVQSILFDMSQTNEFGDSYDAKAKLQINMIQKNKRVVAEASAKCSYDEQTHNKEGVCELLSPANGRFSFKFDGQWGMYTADSALLKLSKGTYFLNQSIDATDFLVQIPDYDGTMKVLQNKKVANLRHSCEAPLYMAHTVSTARFWNEVILHSIRNDLARPTVTARNLFHLSALMWDVFVAYDKNLKGYYLNESAPAITNEKSKEVALNYAAYTFLKERYKNAPANVADNYPVGDGDSGDGEADVVLDEFYARVLKKIDVKKMDSNLKKHKGFGVKMAKKLLASQLNDGSRESLNYAAEETYILKNPDIMDVSQSGITSPGKPTDELHFDFYEFYETLAPEDYPRATELFDLSPYKGKSIAAEIDIDSWVRLNIPGSVDQGGTAVSNEQSPLTLFWGRLPTFGNLEEYKSAAKEGVYFDPGKYLPKFSENPEEMIKQNLAVVDYSSLLNPMDLSDYDFDHDGKPDDNPGAKFIDISPGVLGNNLLGTNNGQGRSLNPITGKPYSKNLVKAADYYRSIAEFWADGPESETPPGHWNTLANYVMDQMAKKEVPYKWMGKGEAVDREVYELKTYLTLNGALHDAAVVAWGIKGAYQGNRPIMVIRKLADMAEKDPAFAKKLLSYSPNLKMVTYTKKETQVDGSVKETEVTKLAVKAWRGTPKGGFIGSVDFGNIDLRDFSFKDREGAAKESEFYMNAGVAGVGWILAGNWQPYQRQSFVTPPFPGFVSGHSTFSRAAAEVLAGVTGSDYFPGGMGTYPAPELHFEYLKMKPFEFQWATYYDASDVSGISRLYGGIHASYDDLPAREIGSKIGLKAVERALDFFEN